MEEDVDKKRKTRRGNYRGRGRGNHQVAFKFVEQLLTKNRTLAMINRGLFTILATRVVAVVVTVEIIT